MRPSLQRLYALYALALVVANAASGQFQQQWEIREFPNAQLASATLKLDSVGNIYVLRVLESNSLYHAFLFKYGSSGQQEWSVDVTDSQPLATWSASLVLDSGDSACICGWITDPDGIMQLFTAKFSSTGQHLWTAKYPDPGNPYVMAHAAALDTQTNVYVLGSSSTINGEPALVLIKYDTEGSGVWTNRYDSPSGEALSPTAILVGRSNEVYVIGYEDGTFPAGPRAVACKYLSDGQLSWTWHQACYPEFDTLISHALLDSHGDIVMAGTGWGHWHRSNGTSTLVTKLGDNGTEKWSRVYYSWASDPHDSCRDLSIDDRDNLFLLLASSVESVSQSKIVKYSPTGEMVWVARHFAPSGLVEVPTAMTVDAQGFMHLAGFLQDPNTHSWCESLQSSQTLTVGLLAKFDTNGCLVWSTNASIAEGQLSYDSILADPNGNLIVTGQEQNCTQTELTLMKYQVLPLPGAPEIQVPPRNQTIEMGAAAVFTVIATGAPPLSYQWFINDQPLACTNSQLTFDAYCPSPTAFSFSVLISNQFGMTRSPEVRATFPSNFTVLGRESDGAIGLDIQGGYFERFVIQVSTNLVDWSLLTRVQGYNSFYRDYGASILPFRFYRCLHQ